MNETYGTDAMMGFRTVYLKAIARSWRDANFLKNLTKNPTECLQKTFNYNLPWDIDLKIEKVSPKESIWDPVNTGGWIGKNAVISIWLPPAPDDTKEYAQAWAAYYDKYPSFLGSKTSSSLSTGTDSPSSEKKYGAPYPLGMGKWSDFLEFTAVIMRLIALAWKDKQVQIELKNIQGTNKGVTILNKWLGYNMTWNMDVEFKLTGWDNNDYRWDSEKMEWPVPRPCRNGLSFYIPNKPGNESSIEAIALSAYNVTGDQYPFTCP